MSKVEVLVPRGAIRAALAAALPHTGANPEHVTSRVRLSFVTGSGDVGVHLVVSASDGYTAVASRVWLHEVTQLPSLAVVDLPVQSAKDVLAVFKPPSGRDDRQVWEHESFRLVVDDEDTTWDEAGQLLDGRSLTVPRVAPLPAAETAYPDVPGVIARALVSVASEKPLEAVSPTLLARVVTSAKAHGEQRVELERRRLQFKELVVWTAGPNLIGALSVIAVDGDGVADVVEIRRDWRDQFRQLARPDAIDDDPAERSEAATALRKAMKDGGIFTFVENGIYEVNLDDVATDDEDADS